MPEELSKAIERTRNDYENWLDAFHAASRGHVDALIDPAFFAATPDAERLKAALSRSLDQSNSYEDFLDRLRLFGQEQMFLVGARILSGALSAELGTRRVALLSAMTGARVGGAPELLVFPANRASCPRDRVVRPGIDTRARGMHTTASAQRIARRPAGRGVRPSQEKT